MSEFATEDELFRTDPALDGALREAFVEKFLEAAGLGDELRSRVGSMFSLARGHQGLLRGPGAPDVEPADLTCSFGPSTDYFYGDTADPEELDAWIEGVAAAAAILYQEELSRGWDAFA
ncbi:MAG TPA: hypothetical protein VII47_16525 [Actinomycetota bacterium]|jgi:hypothetical protein